MNYTTATLSLLLLAMPLRASQPEEDTVTLQTQLLAAAGGFIAVTVALAALKQAYYYATTRPMTKQERITAKTGAYLKRLQDKQRAADERAVSEFCAGNIFRNFVQKEVPDALTDFDSYLQKNDIPINNILTWTNANPTGSDSE